jgi:hypothetical protein
MSQNRSHIFDKSSAWSRRPSARLAASAEVGQVEGTTLTINFDSWDGFVAPFFAPSFAFGEIP